MEFSEKLRFYRKEAGLTQLELANRLGVTQGLIVQYETKQGSGKQAVRPKIDKIISIAKILNIAPSDLLDNKENIMQNTNTPADIVTIPKLNILAGAGSEGVFDIELLQSDKSISVSREIIGKLNPTNLKVVEIVGDSMEPEFYEGDLAIIDMVNHRYDFVKIAGIYIVRTQETIYIKKLDFLPKGGIKLISINKSYGDIELNSDDDFEILGKVCGRIHISKGLVFNNQGIF